MSRIADDTDEIARRLAELRAERGRQPPAWLSSPEQLRVFAEMVEAFERWAAEVRRSERRRLRMPPPRGGAE